MSERTLEQIAEHERQRQGLAPKPSMTIISPVVPGEPVSPPDDVTSAEIVGLQKPVKSGKGHARKV